MLLFWPVVSASRFSFGLRLQDRPVAKVGSSLETMKTRAPGIEYDGCKVMMVKSLTPNSITRVHDFLEQLEDEKQDNSKKITGLEVPLMPLEFLSIYYDAFLSGIKPIKKERERLYKRYQSDNYMQESIGATVAVNDYYTEKQRESIQLAFFNIQVNATIVPSSTCAALNFVQNSYISGDAKFAIVNFQGSQVTKTIFELETKDATSKLKMVSTETCELVSDAVLDKLVVDAIKKYLTEEIKDGSVAFLPYDNFKKEDGVENGYKYYADISSLVRKVINNMNDSFTLETFNDNEQYYFAEDGEKFLVTPISIDLRPIRAAILNMATCEIEKPEDITGMYFISDYAMRAKCMNKEIAKIEPSNIVDGALCYGDSKYTVEDSRVRVIDMNSVGITAGYYVFKEEIEIRNRYNELRESIEEKLASFKNISDAAKESLLTDVKGEDNGTLEHARKLVQAYDAMSAEDRSIRVNRVAFETTRASLMRQITQISASSPRIAVLVTDALEEAKKWCEANTVGENDVEVKKVYKSLNTAYLKAQRAVQKEDEEKAAEEEAKRKQEEAEKKASEEGEKKADEEDAGEKAEEDAGVKAEETKEEATEEIKEEATEEAAEETKEEILHKKEEEADKFGPKSFKFDLSKDGGFKPSEKDKEAFKKIFGNMDEEKRKKLMDMFKQKRDEDAARAVL